MSGARRTSRLEWTRRNSDAATEPACAGGAPGEISATGRAREKPQTEGHATKHGQDSKTDAKSDPKSDPKSDTKTDVKPDAKTDGKSEGKPAPKTDGKSAGKSTAVVQKLTSHIRINVLVRYSAASRPSLSLARGDTSYTCPPARITSSRHLRASAASPPVVS